MECRIPVSFGEVVDKITILDLKLIKAQNMPQNQNTIQNTINEKIKNIQHELNRLQEYQRLDDKTYLDFRLKLFNVNQVLWNLEEKIRKKSKLKEFDTEYIQIAENIHKYNDQRYQIKRQINQHYQSDIREEKIY